MLYNDPALWPRTSTALISFTISGLACQAEAGMTWSDWIGSGYNPGEYTKNGGMVCKGSHPVQFGSSTVSVNDTIVSGAEYTVSTGNGSSTIVTTPPDHWHVGGAD